MENIPKISQAEYIVMDVIWDEGPLSTPEIVARLQDFHDWSPKTIHTLLVRLEKKGAITHTRQSRTYVYAACLDRKTYLDQQTHSFLERFYHGRLPKLVSYLVDEKKLSQEDIEALSELVEKAKGPQS
ncbi:Penicillinase repressor [Clostridiales bacterium CHKCI006]|nr:Penicillinase repressor [Clostridiales bacterium CHKCI006]